MNRINSVRNWMRSCTDNATKRRLSQYINWVELSDIEVVKVPPSDDEKKTVSKFLETNFLPDEPIINAANVSNEKLHPDLMDFFLDFLNDDKSLYARDKHNGEILGVALARMTTPKTARELHKFAETLPNLYLRRYIHFLADIEIHSNVYYSFMVDKVLSLDVVATAKNYRQLGIANLLLKSMYELGTSQPELQLIKFASGNTFASRAAASCGCFKELRKKNIIDFRDPFGIPWIQKELTSPHKNIKIYTGKLKEIENSDKELNWKRFLQHLDIERFFLHK